MKCKKQNISGSPSVMTSIVNCFELFGVEPFTNYCYNYWCELTSFADND